MSDENNLYLNGTEHIDFSGPKLTPTSNIKVTSHTGCTYRSDLKGWAISNSNGTFEFTINIGEVHGFDLVLRLASGLVDGKTDCPISVSINGTKLIDKYDPHNTSWYDKSFYIPPNFVKKGDNKILMHAEGGSTVVFIQRATIMNFHMEHQQQTQWCWSATSVSVSKFYDSNSAWTQCKLVNQELGETTCCSDGSSTACNQTNTLSDPLTRTGNLNTWVSGAASIDKIDDEITELRPIGARIGWPNNNGHFVVISGLGAKSQSIAIEDPWYGSSFMKYDDFKTKYQSNGSWTHTYYTKA